MIVDKMKKRPPTAKNIKSKIDIPVGKWVKCDKCKEIVYKETVRENMSICPNCGAESKAVAGDNCEYCHSKIVIPPKKYVLSKKMVINQK